MGFIFKTKVYGNLERSTIYMCYVSYLVYLFSDFIKTDNSKILLNISKILNEENLLFSVPCSFSITYELKSACFKMVYLN